MTIVYKHKNNFNFYNLNSSKTAMNNLSLKPKPNLKLLKILGKH